MKLSIVLPAIRTKNWKALYESAVTSLGKYSEDFEMIMVGPYPPEDQFPDNFKWIQDWGAPARCAQKGVEQAQGKYLMWASDDGVFLGNALETALDLRDTLDRKDVIVIRYAEGGNSPSPEYWSAHHHADLRLPGIPTHYKIAPVGMYDTDYFQEIGGWDCRYEHLNMCCHDLAFRVQNDGGKIHLSPDEVLSCTWDVHCAEWQPVGAAYRENDAPLFAEIYNKPHNPNKVVIFWGNWQDSPERWVRRFGDE